MEKDTSPFCTLHLDHFGPLEETENGHKNIIVIIDAFTKFVWLFAFKLTGTNEAICHLNSLFGIFGYPKRIISDRGTAYTSTKFSEFFGEKDIKHVKIAVASPWAGRTRK